MQKKNIAILGSTGSIGTQALDCCRNLGYRVEALAANSSWKLLEMQAREYNPRSIAIGDKTLYSQLKSALADTDIRISAGNDGLCELAQLEKNDIVLNSVVGMVGLKPTLAAIEAGKTVALANKETLVAGGRLVTSMAQNNNVDILPVDSEHSAIFQCLQGNRQQDLAKVILTASGGPFRGKTRADLQSVTLEQALRHPNWDMGAKITVDSSTLMNKGLEFIEAIWLFGLKTDQIEVVVHPQSVVHSAVEYVDGSVIAQLGCPDMTIPIQYALTYPNRHLSSVKRLSFTDYKCLDFYPPDLDTFRCLRACIAAVDKGELFPCALNGANEQAVALFLERQIEYLTIADAVEYVLENFVPRTNSREYTLQDVLETDAEAREMVREFCFGHKVR